MAYNDLRDFICAIEKKGLLKRVKAEVDADLEISEILDRNSKNNGNALLFENVKNSEIPVLGNAFGSIEQMRLALERDNFEGIGGEIMNLIKEMQSAKGFSDKMNLLSKLKEISDYFPKTIKNKNAPCKEFIIHDPDLNKFPILKCWPGDGGKFITLPLVFTKNPETGERNCGMYRMQVFDEKTTGMHWHIHKHGAEHFRVAEKLNQKLEVAVAIGTDPATTYASTAPLPDGFDEMIFAGFLRKQGVEMVKCETVDLEIPAKSEIVLEGYVDPHERRLEGPFGDHTGYYSLPDMYPVFHITCITHRKDPIYSTTVVGKPPMEDSYMGKATERIFLSFIKMQIPEIVDINLPVEGVFHNMCIVSINKKYPGHARKVMLSLWGMGQLMFTKIIIVLESDVDVQNIEEVLWATANRIDPKRDIMFIENAPMDVLEHATTLPNIGSKMGIDATKKWKEEGFTREWPDVIEMSADVKQMVDDKWDRYGI